MLRSSRWLYAQSSMFALSQRYMQCFSPTLLTSSQLLSAKLLLKSNFQHVSITGQDASSGMCIFFVSLCLTKMYTEQYICIVRNAHKLPSNFILEKTSPVVAGQSPIPKCVFDIIVGFADEPDAISMSCNPTVFCLSNKQYCWTSGAIIVLRCTLFLIQQLIVF